MRIVDFLNFFYKKYTVLNQEKVLNCIKKIFILHTIENFKKTIIVFDGYFFEDALAKYSNKSKNFTIFFERNADKKIIELMDKNQRGSFEIVSSDNEIIRFAKKKNNKFFKSEDFWIYLENFLLAGDEKKISKKSKLKKTCDNDSSNEEIDNLMKNFS